MKRLLVLPLILLPLWLFAQGFGSFSHDQPFFAKDVVAGGVDPYAVDLYEYWSFNDATVSGTNYGEFGRDIFFSPSTVPTVTNGISNDGRFFTDSASSVMNAFFDGKWWSGYNSWSVSMWIQPYSEGLKGTVFSCWSETTAQKMFLLSYTNNALNFKAQNGSGLYYSFNVYPTNTIPLSNWIHLAFGYDASGVTELTGQANWWFQTNAGPRVSFFVTNVLPSFTIQDVGVDNGSISIGNVASGSQQYIGKIDEFGWWDRMLTTNEISDFYGGGTNPIVYTSDWFNNDYIYPTSHTNLFDPATISIFNFGYDALRPETIIQTNQTVGPNVSGIGITNWYSYYTNLIIARGSAAWTGGVYLIPSITQTALAPTEQSQESISRKPGDLTQAQ